jgi:hypothetical protein
VGQSAACYTLDQRLALFHRWELGNCAGGAQRVWPLCNQLLDILWCAKQCQSILDVATVLTDALRQATFGVTALINKYPEGPSLFHRVKIAALDVLSEADLDHLIVGMMSYFAWHHREACLFGSAEASLTKYELKGIRFQRIGTHP